jgi:hypothetical protein
VAVVAVALPLYPPLIQMEETVQDLLQTQQPLAMLPQSLEELEERPQGWPQLLALPRRPNTPKAAQVAVVAITARVRLVAQAVRVAGPLERAVAAVQPTTGSPLVPAVQALTASR